MAHVEVTKLSGQELAELACTYAALILHDDGQDITGTFPLIQATRSQRLSLLREWRSRATGPSCSLRHLLERTSPAFLASAGQLLAHQLLDHPPPQRLPPQLLKRRMIKLAKSQRQRRKPLHPHLLKKMRVSIWAASLTDSNTDKS